MSTLHALKRAVCFGLVLLGTAFSSLAWAADLKVVQVKNTTGVFASDLHVTFTGTGGHVFVSPVSVIAPMCPVPAVPSNGQVTNTVVIDWGVPCVAPGATVWFWVFTNNGPLAFSSGFWTLNGVNIGPAMPPFVGPGGGGGGGGGGPFWGVVRQTKCFSLRPIIYTPWRRPEGGGCWRRWCCRPRIWYYTRLAICKFVNRRGRLVNSGICIPISNWRFSFRTREKYRWQFRTKRPPDLGGQIIDVNGPIHNGPLIRRAGFNVPGMSSFGNIKSDNQGQTWSSSMDFRSAFSQVAMGINIEPDTAPDLESTVQKLVAHGQNWIDSAAIFGQLRNEVLQVNAAEPGTDLPPIANDLQMLQSSFIGIGNQFLSGVLPNNALLWDNCRIAMQDLSTRLGALMPVGRNLHVQNELISMAEGFRKCRDMVASGFPTMMEEDEFLYALFNRIYPSFDAVSVAMGPHVRLQIDPGQVGWLTHLSDAGIILHITNAATGDHLDSMVVVPSESGAIDIPIDNYDMTTAPQLRIGFKYDTFLSRSIVVPNVDGHTAPIMPLQNGDVNGDDVVDPADAAMVQAALGSGGPDATSIGSEDLNADGNVDFLDLNLVFSNLGQQGDGFKLVSGQLELQDYLGDADEQTAMLDIRDTLGNTLESHELPLGGGEYAFLTNRPSGEVVQVGAKGSHWLRRGVFATIPDHVLNVDFSLINGDGDGDNEVGIGDYAMLSFAYGSEPGDANYLEAVDFNGDLAVDIADYAILSSNFGISGD